MRYFIGAILCIGAVSAEAIPESLKLEPLQTSLYEAAFEASTPRKIEYAQKRAVQLYGKEYGFLGATNRVMKTKDGYRFLYLNIRGDGNCGFYASGVDRATFVKTIEELVNQNDDQYEGFLNERTALATDIPNLMLSDDKTPIADRVKKLVAKADNGGTVAPALKLLTDFATDKTKYHTELFLDAKSDLIRYLQNLEKLPAVKSKKDLEPKIQKIIETLNSASVEAFDIQDFRVRFNALLTEVKTVVNANQYAVTQTEYGYKELIKICGYSDVELFEKAKRKLISEIQNLTTLATYEAFLTALQQELMSSGIKENLDTKEKLLESVANVFSQNRGYGTWIPGGLLAPVISRLNIKCNIWASDYNGGIQLYSGSEDFTGNVAKGETVRNIFFTGGHYDMLIPIDE